MSSFIGKALGAAVGALGSSGRKGGVNMNSTTRGIQKVDILNQALEPEYFSSFRQGLIPAFSKLYAEADKPVYGDAERAQAYHGINKAGADAQVQAGRALARTGRSNSGAADSIYRDIAHEGMDRVIQFNTALPFQERQAHLQNVGGLLGMGMNWAGRAPISQRQVGIQTTDSTTQGTQTQIGPSWGRSFAFGLAGSGMFDNVFNGLGNWWGKRRSKGPGFIPMYSELGMGDN